MVFRLQLTWSPPFPHSDEDPKAIILPKDKLVSLCKCNPILKWMRSCDHILYQALVEVLIPDVLRPVPSKQLAAPAFPPSCPCTPAATLSGPAQTWDTENLGRAVAQSSLEDAHPCLPAFLVTDSGREGGAHSGLGWAWGWAAQGCGVLGLLCPQRRSSRVGPKSQDVPTPLGSAFAKSPKDGLNPVLTRFTQADLRLSPACSQPCGSLAPKGGPYSIFSTFQHP